MGDGNQTKQIDKEKKKETGGREKEQKKKPSGVDSSNVASIPQTIYSLFNTP